MFMSNVSCFILTAAAKRYHQTEDVCKLILLLITLIIKKIKSIPFRLEVPSPVNTDIDVSSLASDGRTA